jgi:hypothetical protein
MNLLSYYLKQMVHIYHPPAKDDRAISEYLHNFSHCFHQSRWSEFIIKKSPRLSESQVKVLMGELEKLPELPDSIHERLRTIYGFIQKILDIQHDDETQYWREMYELSGNWLEKHKEAAMQLISSSQILAQADNFENLYNRRTDIYFDYYLQWGKEYHEYYQNALSEQLTAGKAHGAAWKFFVNNHPITNDSEGQITPGHSRYILKKYQKIYLEWRDNNA